MGAEEGARYVTHAARARFTLLLAWLIDGVLMKGLDGVLEAHIRGRRLRGREVRVPKGYRGVVVRDEGGVERKDRGGCRDGGEGVGVGEDGEEDEVEGEVRVLQEIGGFEEIVVWDHESVGEAGDDGVVRGVEEWVGFSGVVCLVFLIRGGDFMGGCADLMVCRCIALMAMGGVESEIMRL